MLQCPEPHERFHQVKVVERAAIVDDGVIGAAVRRHIRPRLDRTERRRQRHTGACDKAGRYPQAVRTHPVEYARPPAHLPCRAQASLPQSERPGGYHMSARRARQPLGLPPRAGLPSLRTRRRDGRAA